MTQPYSKLQETFKTASAVPKIPARRIRILPQAALAESVHLRGGRRPGDVGFDFEDLRIRKEMMGRADGIFPDGYQSIQRGFRF